jgi:hypothetical protein
MNNHASMYTEMERRHVDALVAAKVADDEFERAKELFDEEPYPSVKMSPADLQELQALLPNVNMALVKDAEVKAREGAAQQRLAPDRRHDGSHLHSRRGAAGDAER